MTRSAGNEAIQVVVVDIKDNSHNVRASCGADSLPSGDTHFARGTLGRHDRIMAPAAGALP